MSTSLVIGGIRAGFSWSFTKSTTFGSDTSNSGAFSYGSSLTSGTGAGTASVFYADEITIAAGATTNLDLAASLTDIFGASISFAKIRLLYIEVLATDASTGTSISVGGHASAACASFFGDSSDKIKVKNGGCFQLSCKDAAGYAVTATTGDIIKIVNDDNSNPVVVRIGIAGE